MTVSEKIKTIDIKNEQNKAQYNLDRQAPKISALSSRNVSKYEFSTRDFLPMKRLLQKAVTIKSFKYLSLESALKKQTSIAEKVENQRFHDDFEELTSKYDE